MQDDLQSDIAAAMETVANGETTESPPDVAGDVGGVPSHGATEDTTPALDSGVESPSAAAQRARDDKGRFAEGKAESPPKVAAKPLVTVKPTLGKPGVNGATSGSQVGESRPPTPQLGDSPKPPASWKPAARETWASLPPAAQAEVVRREREVTAALQEAAPLRHVAEAMQRMVAPHAAIFRQQGMDPLQGTAAVLQTYEQLRNGGQGQKAEILATLIQSSGVDVELLAKVLDGQQGGQNGNGQQQQQAVYSDPRVDQLIGHLEQAAQQRQAISQQKRHSEIAAFAEGKEFFEDLRPEMSDILAGAARRGVAMTLEEAYTRAGRANPEVWPYLQQREAAEAAKASTASTSRARAAGSTGLRTQPSGAQAPQGDSIADDIQAAMQHLSTR